VFPPLIADVIFRATLLAQHSGASEIGIDTLLAALDEPAPSMSFPIPGEESGAFYFNSDWIPFSDEVVKVLAPFGGLEEIDVPTLRKVLVSARKKDPDQT
jgi:hypothetical protein